jgi:hypothetical protein
VELLNCGKQAGSILLCPPCELIISVKPDTLWRQQWTYLKHGTSPHHKKLGSHEAESDLVLCDIERKWGGGGGGLTLNIAVIFGNIGAVSLYGCLVGLASVSIRECQHSRITT